MSPVTQNDGRCRLKANKPPVETLSLGFPNAGISPRTESASTQHRFATATMCLEPLDLETGLEMYLRDKGAELAASSVKSHRYRLKHFLSWCDKEDIDNLNGLTGRKIQQYRLWRRDDGDLSIASEKTQMDTLRVFIRWAESVDAVEQDLSTKVRSPSMTTSRPRPTPGPRNSTRPARRCSTPRKPKTSSSISSNTSMLPAGTSSSH